jgi:thiol:disulfide interchange protein DsbD
VAAFVGAAGFWLALRVFAVTVKPVLRTLFLVLGLSGAVAAGAVAWQVTGEGAVRWVPYTPSVLEGALGEGQTVVMVFTAEWCLNCKALEQSVLRTPEVERVLQAPDVVPMKVDLTGRNSDGKAQLERMGSLTIPLLAVIAPDGTPVLTSDFYTGGQIVEAVKRARKRPAVIGPASPAPAQSTPGGGAR